MRKMGWISILGLIACGSALANDADKFKQTYAGKPYAEAREAILAEGWLPFKPIAAPGVVPSAYRAYPEFIGCDDFSCDFAFERSDEILEVATSFGGIMQGTGIDPKQRYVEIMTKRIVSQEVV